MTARSLRNIETRKKKAAHRISRKKVSRPQGNSPAGRRKLKKQAGLRYGRDKVAATASE